MMTIIIICLVILVCLGVLVVLTISKGVKDYDRIIEERKSKKLPSDSFNGLFVDGLKDLNSDWSKFIWNKKYYLGWQERGQCENGTMMIEITKEQYDAEE